MEKLKITKLEKLLKIKTEHYLKLLICEAMKSLESSENTITSDKYGDNVPHLEITEIILVHCNFLKMNIKIF